MAAPNLIPCLNPRGKSVRLDTLITYAMPHQQCGGYLKADKLHNARSLLAEWRQRGDTIWANFSNGKEGTLWFYRSLVQVYRETGSDFLTEEQCLRCLRVVPE